MKNPARRYLRGTEYLLRYLFVERPMGLDFSIRDKTTGITLPGNRGYALTSKKALKNILKQIPHAGKALLDIGSGKGGVICYAYELGLKTCEGIEFEEHLHKIAERNIKKLGYSSQVKSTNVDARKYERYADFDIYFMFNPFNYDIYAEVLNSIIEQNKKSPSRGGEKFLICYGDANIDAVRAANSFSLIVENECPYRGNTYRIFKMNL
jgi:16S rRNA G966 N2-methylase RsmD